MLTRLLYLVEHVKQNIVYCIQFNEKQELSYWLAEYYYSGYQEECMEWLTQIYYQYYALTYPCFEKYIHKKRILYSNTNDYAILVYIANNLRIKKHSTYYDQAAKQSPKINRGRKPSWLSVYTSSLKPFVYLISKQDWNNVYKRIQSSQLDSLPEMYESVCQYANNHESIDPELLRYYHTITANYQIDTIKQMLFATCLHITQDYPINTSYGSWLTHKKRLTIYTSLVTNDRPYETLKLNVKYPTRQTMTQSQLVSILQHWLLYSYACPLWRERIDHYGGKQVNQSIVFANDEKLEAFSDTYGYELDEQTNNMYKKLYSVSFTQ